MLQRLKLFGVLAVLALAAPALGATTWTEDRSDPRVRVAKAVCTTGTEAAPPTPAKASEGINLSGIVPGDRLVITGASPSPVEFTAHATRNDLVFFKVGANDAATATNLAAAINRTALSVNAEAQLAQLVVSGKAYGTAANGVALNYAGAVGAWTCNNACLLFGGVDPVGLGMYGVKGFSVVAEAGLAMTAGGKLTAYLLNETTMKWAPAPDLDLTVAALAAQAFAGREVVSDWGRIAYVPVGVGQAGTVYLVGRTK